VGKREPNDRGDNLKLATDDLRRTVFHMAAGHSGVDILPIVSKWANGDLTAEKVKYNYY
jgi:hypothetical protein